MKWIAIAITVSKKTILFPCGGLINRRTKMSDHRNQIILESLYQKYLDLGHENAEALELAAKEFEENSN